MATVSLPLFTFIESRVFSATATAAGITGPVMDALQERLLDNPEAGVTVAGTGGARKIRVALPGRGKRGGSRVIYYYAVRPETIHLLLAYPKNVQATLTQAHKKLIRSLVQDLAT